MYFNKVRAIFSPVLIASSSNGSLRSSNKEIFNCLPFRIWRQEVALVMWYRIICIGGMGENADFPWNAVTALTISQFRFSQFDSAPASRLRKKEAVPKVRRVC